MNWSFCWVLCIPLAVGCELAGGTASVPSGRKAEPTPEIIAKAESLLKENADAKVGTEIPFRLNGKRYVGRVEEHDNPSGEPGRPAGKHKGITVYVSE